MRMEFTKMHGCGNDYVYVNCLDKELLNPNAISEYVSHRRFGVGADGLICIHNSKVADFRMRMFNADGSEGKMCGNGIRCVAKYVYDKGLTTKTEITVETLGGIKTIEMILAKDGKVAEAIVDMGTPELRTSHIPMISDHGVFVDQSLNVYYDYSYKLNGTCLSMGNPHFVIFVDEVKKFDIDNFDIKALGSTIEHHRVFPERTNVEFVTIVDENTVRFRVWERGSGETWACGTGACAVAYSSIILKHAGKKGSFMNVIAKGGTLQVKVSPENNHIFLKGPATLVFEGIMDIPEEILSKSYDNV